MNNRGFTLIETLIAITILAIVSTAIYFSYSNVLEIFSASYLNLTALSLLDSELELIRNMPYTDVGVQGGVPAGVIAAAKNINYSNIDFVVKTAIRNIDDSFDGTQGGSPNDTAPADYKLVELEITCPTCPRFIPARATTTVAPQGLETVTNNGTLIIRAIDASGQPVVEASVLVINNSISPAININDVTDSSGFFKIIDTPPSSAGYAVTVSKSGYSTDRNYRPGDPLNPNPLKPYATVVAEQITQTSFIIDRVSVLNVKTQDKFCVGIGNIGFLQTGQKLIGTNPDVFKYSLVHTTDSTGNKTVGNLEFDAYDFKNQSAVNEISGFSPMTPIAVDPDGTYGLTWLIEPKSPSAITVTVVDQNDQPINDAKVTLTKTGFSDEKYTGRKFVVYTDWSGGNFDSKSINIEEADPAGELRIKDLGGGKYASMSDEWLVSKTLDFGTSDVDFYNLIFNPTSQPAQTSLKIQIATNNDNSTWNFVGPDGTSNTYYTINGIQIYQGHNDKRYLRYKIVLRTDDENVTPSFQDLALDFNSSCVPEGQSYFSGLNQGTYKIKIEKAGYQTFNDNSVGINANWIDYRAVLSP
ncbi:MAG: hypothetical protein A3B91_02890 [Candidatus Yanofskybacteria bacterium RIFCSPHIGHO2_02_FULL_41_29]|uniref:Uncharacterized protein n=1 Tax=Candidatus Yanofskybacteria bacterium RIFCSPHIGHO2_01_FULL_41_53 TaxID=1802663 RepID=A0A1F8EJL9_9BACT|nr:MAG: hypothetical protein A2650_02240 [Candidatus Yanofskybacteria bacterium RIFCSPHIGHO2_01_FULL_41_53]OGN12210.1 MAG: hypothetical protein A3B91_02890 [Candidatus Yanofskybacteria bacterium RIFCSPHIGHO2_02_FULL_41_29]OGN23824.1 MAG: hypothetical protein A2916_01170 [Candidatus Yanofskybacteria bacterium RIFCSPLOWO2_01_FULL_41_67]OGN28560.1 MAG: hypothetical protein A3H54_04875 [Candidatus Yanofskybacteria bacterium RIFCSPLOWO2_02_FULL_41_13]OGN37024.1 MAG: hypothetical protein A3F98_01950 